MVYLQKYLFNRGDNTEYSSDSLAKLKAGQTPKPTFDAIECNPNPFSQSTTIEFALKETTPVTISVHNMSGKKHPIKRLLVFAFVAAILCSSCTKIQNSPEPTPLTSYNMSAYASGEFLTFNASCNNNGDSILSIIGIWNTNISETYDMDFYFIRNTTNYIGTYALNLTPDGDFYAVPNPFNGSDIFAYETNSTHTGSLSITAYDSINKTISGTFGFTGYGYSASQKSAAISITNGVFTKVPL